MSALIPVQSLAEEELKREAAKLRKAASDKRRKAVDDVITRGPGLQEADDRSAGIRRNADPAAFADIQSTPPAADPNVSPGLVRPEVRESIEIGSALDQQGNRFNPATGEQLDENNDPNGGLTRFGVDRLEARQAELEPTIGQTPAQIPAPEAIDPQVEIDRNAEVERKAEASKARQDAKFSLGGRTFDPLSPQGQASSELGVVKSILGLHEPDFGRQAVNQIRIEADESLAELRRSADTKPDDYKKVRERAAKKIEEMEEALYTAQPEPSMSKIVLGTAWSVASNIAKYIPETVYQGTVGLFNEDAPGMQNILEKRSNEMYEMMEADGLWFVIDALGMMGAMPGLVNPVLFRTAITQVSASTRIAAVPGLQASLVRTFTIAASLAEDAQGSGKGFFKNDLTTGLEETTSGPRVTGSRTGAPTRGLSLPEGSRVAVYGETPPGLGPQRGGTIGDQVAMAGRTADTPELPPRVPLTHKSSLTPGQSVEVIEGGVQWEVVSDRGGQWVTLKDADGIVKKFRKKTLFLTDPIDEVPDLGPQRVAHAASQEYAAPKRTAAGYPIVVYAPPENGKKFGMPAVIAEFGRVDQIRNIVKSVTPFATPDHMWSRPIMKMREIVTENVNSVGAALGQEVNERLLRAFPGMDKKGGAWTLPGIPGSPTVNTLFENLPKYSKHLTAGQLAVVHRIGKEVGEYLPLYEEVGGKLEKVRVADGGYYMPRGNATPEHFDGPSNVGKGSGRKGKAGAEKARVWDTQEAGVKGGDLYPSPGEAITNMVTEMGNRSLDLHTANILKQARGPDGKLLSRSLKQRMIDSDSDIERKHSDLIREKARLDGIGMRLRAKQDGINVNATLERFLHDPQFDADRDISDLTQLLEELKDVRVSKGKNVGQSLPEIRLAFNQVKKEIRDMASDWRKAKAAAAKTPAGEGTIEGLASLQGHTFDGELAAAVVAGLKDEEANMLSAFLRPVNQLFRALRATGDNSGPGIQGLLGLASDPVAYVKAMNVNIQSWGSERVMGGFLVDFNDRAVQTGRLSSLDWGRSGLAILGKETEFAFQQGTTGLTSKVRNLPVLKQAERAFGNFGDSLRLAWADDMLAAEMNPGRLGGRGRTLQDVIDSGDMRRIAEIANNMTGYASKRAGGNFGDALLFAPRFFQARIETLVKGTMGLRPGAPLDQRIARNSLTRLIGGGAALTFAINWALGNETDVNPLNEDGKLNTNFMTIRAFGRDISLFGTYQSMFNAVVLTAQGEPERAWRNLSSGVISMGWDLVTGQDGGGKQVGVELGNAGKGKKVWQNPAAFWQWMLTNSTPFFADEIIPTVQQFREGERVAATVSLTAEVFGVKSSRVSPSEHRRQIEQPHLDAMRAEQAAMTPEELKAVGPSMIVVDGPLKDQNAGVRREIKGKPDVMEATEKARVISLERGSEYAEWDVKQEAEREKFDANIKDLAEEVGPGQDFRIIYGEKSKEYATRREEQRLSAEEDGAFDFFDEDLDEGLPEFDEALNAFFAVVTDERWENPTTGRRNYDAIEQGIKADVVDMYGQDMLDEIHKYLEEHDSPTVKALKEARRVLKPYYQIGKDYQFSPEFDDDWQDYLDADIDTRATMLREIPQLKVYNKHLTADRKSFKEKNPAVEFARIIWYGVKYVSQAGKNLRARLDAGTFSFGN